MLRAPSVEAHEDPELKRNPMSTLRAIREEVANRRNARNNRRELERQLAAYDTPSARLEIETVLDRHDPDETREIRAILRQQAAERLARAGR
jgi:hypothetical protein